MLLTSYVTDWWSSTIIDFVPCLAACSLCLHCNINTSEFLPFRVQDPHTPAGYPVSRKAPNLMLHDGRDRAACRQWARTARDRTKVVRLLRRRQRALLEARVNGAAFCHSDAGLTHRHDLHGLPGPDRVRGNVERLEYVRCGAAATGAKGDGCSTGERRGHQQQEERKSGGTTKDS